MTAHVEGLFEAVPPQGQRWWPGRRRQWQEVRPRQEGRGKHPHGKSRDGGADLADLQQLGWSQPPVIWGEWVPVAPVRQEMPPQSQHGLGCSVHGGADLADLQQLGRSQPPVIWGEWVPVAPVRQEMPPQSQHGLGCSVPPPFVYELWLGLGMSWLFFFDIVCYCLFFMGHFYAFLCVE